MTYSLTWLPTVLRGAKLHVVETDNWQTRGDGDIGRIKLIICHHTASQPPANAPDLQMVMHGRPDVPPPLCHLLLARDGTYFAVAAGKANHAGKGSWPGVFGGNDHAIGIEAENNGLGELWPEVQMDAYARGCAALAKHVNLTEKAVIGHKEWAPTRKIDPAFQITMDEFRARVAKYL